MTERQPASEHISPDYGKIGADLERLAEGAERTPTKSSDSYRKLEISDPEDGKDYSLRASSFRKDFRPVRNYTLTVTESPEVSNRFGYTIDDRGNHLHENGILTNNPEAWERFVSNIQAALIAKEKLASPNEL